MLMFPEGKFREVIILYDSLSGLKSLLSFVLLYLTEELGGGGGGKGDWSIAKPMETHSASLCLKVPGPPWSRWLLPSLSLPTLGHFSLDS